MRICDGHGKLLNPKRRRFPHATAPCLAVACSSASRIDRQPPLAVPSRRCRAVALRTPSGAAAAQTPRSTHPEEEASPCICLPTATISSSVCDATPPQAPMCGQPMHRLHYGPVSTSTLAPRFVGRGERHATPTHISPSARCPAPRRKVFSCVGGSAATSTDHAEFPPLL
ncbi:hypothetical protein ED352_06730 [Muribaculaceae bacterium Isolate-002 (NCI)]|nr:hypothetical protein ED352_06730 [Muribaculaceae bacterium Isolate-002 (NCI)]